MSSKPLFTHFISIILLIIGITPITLAQTVHRYVEVGGVTSGDCENPNSPCTLDHAIFSANEGDVLILGEGTFPDDEIDIGVTLRGLGPDLTILNNLLISADNVTIENVQVTGGTSPGIDIRASNFTLRHAAVNGYARNIEVATLSLTDITVDNCNLNDATNTAFWVNNTGSIDGLTITNTTMDNASYGLYLQNDNGSNNAVTNVTIRNSTFNNNTRKGMYIEKLNNALFENISVVNSGTDATYAWNAGIDINLKSDTYTDITIRNSYISGCGSLGPNNAGTSEARRPVGMTIKARTDAPSYNAVPASLSNVTLDGVYIDGLVNDLRFGEVDKTDNNGVDMSTVTLQHCVFDQASGGYELINEENNGTLTADHNHWQGAATPNTATFSTASIDIDNGLVLTNPIVDENHITYATLTDAIAGTGNTIQHILAGTVSGTTTVTRALTLSFPGAGYLDSDSRVTFENLTVNGGNLTLAGDVAISGSLDLTNNLLVGDYNMVLEGTQTGSGSITANDAGGLVLVGSGDVTTLRTSGTFDRVVVNRAGADITLTADMQTEHLALEQGYIDASAFDMVMTGTPIHGSNDSYVKGTFSLVVAGANVNNQLIFPIGQTTYKQLLMKGVNQVVSETYDGIFNESDPDAAPTFAGTDPLDALANNAEWVITPSSPADVSNVSRVALTYDHREQVSDPTNLRVAHLQGADWVNLGGSGTSPILTPGTNHPNPITAGIASYHFTLGNEGGTNFTSSDNVYVDGTATDDTGAGTMGDPKKTVAAGYAMVADGTGTLRIATGTYAESLTVHKDIDIIGTGSPVLDEITLEVTGNTYTGITADVVNVSSPATIQEAIDLSADAGTVNVSSGVFAENLDINKNLTLNGANAGISGNGTRGNETIVDPASNDDVMTVGNFNVTIDGFQIGTNALSSNALTGITYSSLAGVSCTVQNNVIYANSSGISIYNTIGTTINVSDNLVNMLALEDPVNATNPSIGVLGHTFLNSNVSFSNNNISGASYGYLVYYADNSSDPLLIDGGEITECTKGIEVDNTDRSTLFAPAYVTVQNVTISDFDGPDADLAQPDTQAGIYVFAKGSSSASTIDDVTIIIDNVDISGVGNSQTDYSAIYMADFQENTGPGGWDGTDDDDIGITATMTNSHIHDNLNRGVYVRGRNATLDITQSNISENGADPASGTGGHNIAARAYGQCTVTNSYFTSPGTQIGGIFDGFHLEDANSSISISLSSFNENGNGTISDGGGIDLSFNYFNSIDENEIALWVGVDDDFTPYFASGTDTDLVTEGFQPDLSSLYITTLGSQTMGTSRKQEAHDLIDEGGTLNVNDGDYTGSLISITKNLTVILTGTPEIDDLTVTGNKTLTIQGDLLVHGDITLTNSFIDIQSGAMSLGTLAGDITESSTAYITGTVTMQPEVYSTGPIINNLGVSLFTTSSLGEVSITRTTGPNAVVTGLPDNSIAAVWEITSTTAPIGVTNIEFSWFSAFDNGYTNTQLQSMGIFRDPGSGWVQIGGSNDLSGSDPRTFSITGLDDLGMWTFASDGAALPVELVSFKAKNELDHVLLNWQTASEINHDYFEIQRSRDRENFEALEKVSSHHNSTTLQNYEKKDYKPLSGKSYYRLKMVDFDGHTEYSPIVSVSFSNQSLVLFPNPTSKTLNIQSDIQASSVEAYNTSGKRTHLAIQNQQIDVSSLQPGIYILKIISNVGVTQSKFIKE
ncbi:T9SS type A sorting domain-containing protein [Reichenbachiella carrageenanivorans]|uniref:T9SS type A sorting domain-containing protein n=1 Tax=Reichenbachiella carrageenanivorans TaxID=2979869 RepID=A0ABY6D3M7_9BACT|nr:T9SS type A sorting domain-containing protein [Reichenbachiella carrageenanivorans]UXX79713.1 T9SS type A sorting domain-containing protein [Reichenbachiella carrageenanivorans]